jgi:hypothetical protein
VSRVRLEADGQIGSWGDDDWRLLVDHLRMTTNTRLQVGPQAAEHLETPQRRSASARAAVRRWYGPLFHAVTWKETAALLLALPSGIVWFTLVCTGLSVSASLLITGVGFPLLLVVVRFGRLVAAVERVSARALLDIDPAPFPPVASQGTAWARLRNSLTDRPSWKAIAYAVVSLPIGIVTFTATMLLWTVSAAMTTFPAYQTAMSNTQVVPDRLSPFVHGWGRVGSTTAVGLLGLILLALTPRLVHRLADAQRRCVQRWLSGPRRAA